MTPNRGSSTDRDSGRFPVIRMLDFLSRVFPFNTLSQEDLRVIFRRSEIAYFPRGQVIVRAGSEPVQDLMIIYSGSVRLTEPGDEGEERLVDIRGEGETIGAAGIIQGGLPAATITAMEDLLVFLLPARDFTELLASHDAFRRHFTLPLAGMIRAYFTESATYAYRDSNREGLMEMAVQMRGRASELMNPKVFTCAPEVTIREAAIQMTRKEVGSIVVADGSGNPLGLVTDTDLRTRVLAVGLSPDAPVVEVMSRPPLTISKDAFAFEALLEMTRRAAHHLLVTDADRVVGIITDHDINMVTGSSPLGLAREIDKVTSPEDVSRFYPRLLRVLKLLVHLNSSSDYMMDLVSEIIDRLYLKLFGICERRMIQEGLGGAPVRYTWLAMGRAGRNEQAPPYRHDYILIYEDVPDVLEGGVREWFMGFARRVNDALSPWMNPTEPTRQATFSVAVCCQKASAWHGQFREWLKRSMNIPERYPELMFDTRVLKDDLAIGESFREGLWAELQAPGVFQALAKGLYSPLPPLGFFRNYVVGMDGNYTDTLDIERHGLDPLVNAARIMALDLGIESTNTLVRLRRAAEALPLDKGLEDDLHEAFGFITFLWVSRYLEVAETGGKDDRSLSASGMSLIQRKTLKNSFAAIRQLQVVLQERYAGDYHVRGRREPGKSLNMAGAQLPMRDSL